MYLNLEKDIVDEIRSWSEYALEKPNPYFNNLPPCPYARAAWKDEKVSFMFKYSAHKQDIYTAVSCFDDTYDLIIIVDFAFEEDPQEFDDYLSGMNEAVSEGIFINRDIWLMGFHPLDDANEFIDDGSFESDIEDPYALIFVQRLSKIQESADKIKEKGYYDSYLEEFNASEIYQQRRNLYRRLRHGDETS